MKTATMENVKKTDDLDIGYSVDVNLKDHDKIENKTRRFPLSSIIWKVYEVLFRDFLNSG